MSKLRIVLHLSAHQLVLHSHFSSSLSIFPKKISLFSSQPLCVSSSRRSSVLSVMDNSKSNPTKELPAGFDATMLEDYASLSKLLQEFTDIPTIDKAWTFKSDNEDGSHAMFSISQPNTLANKRRKSILCSHILQKNSDSVTFQWAPFPIGVSAMVPSPSGTKLLIIRNPEDGSPTHFEIWDPSDVMKDFVVAQSVHGSAYADGWFEGISWNSDETAVAYVAEEPNPPKPTFNNFGFKTEGTTGKECCSWKGQGDWEEDWGETYVGKTFHKPLKNTYIPSL